MDGGPGATSPRRKREKREDVRARLVAAAAGVFAERGYEGASLERVAEAGGLSKGAVYSNFASKDELLFELVAARIDERLEAVRASTESVPHYRPQETAAPEPPMPGRARQEPRPLEPPARHCARSGSPTLNGHLLFLEFWLRCARNEELRSKLAARRREMRGRIADLIEAKAEAAGATIARAEAMDLATTALALSNGFGIEGIIDAKAAPPRLMGEVLSRIVSGARFGQDAG